MSHRLLRIHGYSMSPALRAGDLVLVAAGVYHGRTPARGEVVAARPKAGDGRTVVKRIAGLPNEQVAIGNRRWRLTEEQFFLLGDRTDQSTDSRAFGPVSREELIGPVQTRLWPWKSIPPQQNNGDVSIFRQSEYGKIETSPFVSAGS